MDVSRGKNICKEHLVNIWFFGDSFITLKTIQRGVLLTYGLALEIFRKPYNEIFGCRTFNRKMVAIDLPQDLFVSSLPNVSFCTC